ncbi:hypothetical protein [Salinigranum sp. GCM10025319]|uniref:hypothetical protein n=1 Tax=Salinigranum sp. GCM10025319 TaxID=3252687 RepID=UPI003613BE88
MAGKQGDVLPDTLHTWVSEQAAVSDEDIDDVLTRAVTLYRLVEEHAESLDEGDEMPSVDDLTDFDERLDDLVGRLATLDDRAEHLDRRVGAVEDDLDEKITDVRERVVQVKREADAKASADHDHPELRDGVDRADSAATRATERVDDLEAHVDRGFDNYEEVVSYLVDETDDLDDKLTRIVSIAVDLRRRATEAERTLARLESAAELKREANRQGETAAKCEACSGRVGIGLLTEPRCPHCDARFAGIDPSSRFFGSATLTTDDTPALTAGATPDGDDGDDGDNGNSEADTREARSDRPDTDETVTTTTELFAETAHE